MRKAIVAAAYFSLACLTALAAKQPTAKWIGTWASSPMGDTVDPGQPEPANSTYRDIVHTSIPGTAFRLQLTNEFGTSPLKVGAVHTALSAGNGAIQPGSDHAVTFGGRATVTIPEGAMVVSDPIQVSLPAEANLAVSVYLPDQPIRETTCHHFGGSTNYIFQGNAVTKEDAQGAWKIYSWCFVKGVDVIPEKAEHAAAIVTLGDSITDGALSTRDANARWPDVLARRLQQNPATANLGVLDQGIGGNCILNRCTGEPALARFDRDVLAQSGVKYVILLEGINDIGATKHPRSPDFDITADDLIFGMKQIIDRAHQHGIKVFGGTITPYEGAGYYSDHGEQIREAVNQWIRTSGAFDGVVDFDQATRDATNPKTFAPAVQSPDHLHPTDPGYKIMGGAVNLSLFR